MLDWGGKMGCGGRRVLLGKVRLGKVMQDLISFGVINCWLKSILTKLLCEVCTPRIRN